MAEETALAAGNLLRAKWSQPRSITTKGFRDWVTDADYASQELIVSRIRSHYPRSEFWTEEESESPTSARSGQLVGRLLWIVDPIDGTSNYSRHQPNYCVSIAAAVMSDFAEDDRAPGEVILPEDRWAVVVGVIYDPMRNELFSAVAGQGSFLNRQAVTVSGVTELGESIIGLDWSRPNRVRQSVIETLGRLAPEVHTLRAIGSAALALAWVAAGRLDFYFNLTLSAWDAAAGSLLIREAGGTVYNLEGRPWQLSDGTCLASNGRIHNKVSTMFEGFVNRTASQ